MRSSLTLKIGFWYSFQASLLSSFIFLILLIIVKIGLISTIADFSTSNYDFKGVGVQAGISPGFFIGDVSLSATMSGGIFHAGTGFIAGGSLDIPVGESFEVRLTTRNNIVQKDGGGFTGWIGAGLSLGYEF